MPQAMAQGMAQGGHRKGDTYMNLPGTGSGNNLGQAVALPVTARDDFDARFVHGSMSRTEAEAALRSFGLTKGVALVRTKGPTTQVRTPQRQANSIAGGPVPFATRLTMSKGG